MNNFCFAMRVIALVMLVLFASTSVAPAVPLAFLGSGGNLVTQIPVGTVDCVDQNKRAFQLHWLGGRRRNKSHEGVFNTTTGTAYSGGSWANVVKGARVQVTFHFEGAASDIVIADKVEFVSGS
jgi:hypothetical protein